METTTELRTLRPDSNGPHAFNALPEPGTRIRPVGAWLKTRSLHPDVESRLEGGFLPDRDTLVSFLVNALYLFGDQDLAVYGGAPDGVAAELGRLGHRVTTGRFIGTGHAADAANASGSRPPGTGIPYPVREGGRDRALFLARAFGRGEDADILAALRAMRKTVRPGGLLCFHVFDRDRAFSLAEARTRKGSGVRAAFEPGTGRLTARAEGGPGAFTIKAWNVGEMRALLRSAGLELERAYGDWEGRSPASAEHAGEGRLIIVAARPRIARKAKAARKGGSP
jgi:hypothetical protein